MRVPLRWLKEYVDITWPIEKLSERLTLAGLEVAAIERIGEEWDPAKIRVGQVVDVSPHPDADRLTLVTVDYGAAEPMTVVTGAPNLQVGDRGQKVAFALAGARLIDGHAEGKKWVELRPSRIRGVLSAGMVCSEKELGLSDYHDEVIILPDDAPVGVPLRDYLGDVVLDLDLTPNLTHCFSIVGVAREVAALTGAKARIPAPKAKATGPAIGGQIKVNIADPDLCARYSAALVRDVKVGPSPLWMQHRLRLAGLRPLNNVVDITNYCMLEWGQPLHAFDYDRIRGQTIVVRRARPGERITTLDGQEHVLDPEMLLITDGAGPVAVAGVMGGLESEVTEKTTNVLIEAANFNNISVRRTSQLLKIPSEAAMRFGKGVDPELTVIALARAAELMRLLCDGEVADGFADAYPVRSSVKRISITAREVRRILGIELSVTRIAELLSALEYQCDVIGDEVHVAVPTYRLDVSIPADLIEDIARLIGYDNIPMTLMSDVLPPQRDNPRLELEERIRDILVGVGLDEVITYSLTNLRSVARLSPGGEEGFPQEDYIRIANPLTPEREYMRRTLMNSLLETLRHNLRYTDRIAVFEIGRVYLPVPGEPLPQEPRRLGIAMTGPRMPRSWMESAPSDVDFYDLKGVVETLLARLGLVGAYEPVGHPTLQPGRTAQLSVGGVNIGVLGEVHPVVRSQFDLPERTVCLAEFDLEALEAQVPAVRYYQTLSRYPAVVEDLAIVVDESIPAAKVREVIVEAGGELLRGVSLFDLYRGDSIPAGKKSLTFSLTYQSLEHTLTDRQVQAIRERIIKRLAKELGAKLRA